MAARIVRVNLVVLLGALLLIGALGGVALTTDLWLPWLGTDAGIRNRAQIQRAVDSGQDSEDEHRALTARQLAAQAARSDTQARQAAAIAGTGRSPGVADGASPDGGSGQPVREGESAPGVPGSPAAQPAAIAAEPEPLPIETIEGQQFNPNLRGRLDEASAIRVRGWVQDKFEPEAQMTVLVFIDEAPAMQIAASKREAHKTEGVIWRFEAEAHRTLQDGQKHTIRAYATRQDQHGRTELAGSPRAINQGSIPRGKLEAASAEKGISGYAWDPDSGQKPVKIVIAVDGNPVAFLQANLKNEELKKRQIAPTDTCAFKADWPKVLDDGQEHTLQVYAVDNETGNEHEIEGSPRIIRNSAGQANQPPAGAFDICNKVVMAGWAWDPDAGTGASDVEVWIDGHLFQTVTANSKRDQLRWSRVTPDAFHGWVMTTPAVMLDGATHTVRAFALNYPTGVKVELAGSPKQYRVEENSLPMGGFWHADEKALLGWAADPDLGTKPTEVEVYINGKFWQRFVADKREEWLVGSGLAPNAEHGFRIEPPEFTRDGKEHSVQIFAVNSPEGPAANLGTRTIGVNSIFPGFWTQDRLLDTRIDKGLYVSGVSPWYDAYHKGVKKGDVLLAWAEIEAGVAAARDKDGKITREGTMTADFRVWLNKNRKSGDMLKLKLWRDGETLEVEVKLGELKGQ